MAFLIADRVVETTSTTGTGTYNLAGPASGFQSFVAGVGDGNETYFVVTDGTDWEVGIGTISAGSPDTISRDTILQSTNSDAAVNWGSGAKDIFLSVPADRIVTPNVDTTFSGDITISGDTTISGGLTLSESAQNSISSFTTGDTKLTLKTSADTGWVMADDGTIGNASSGASNRANADTEDLFTLLWNNISNTYAAVSGGRGASAAADFAANKTIALPKALGRALAVAGAGASLTSRALGETLGAETHTLTESEMPAHTHETGYASQSTNPPSHGVGSTTDSHRPGLNTDLRAGNPLTDSAGGGAAHNNMQPTTFLNAMIKL